MSLYNQLLHLASNRNFCCQCIWLVLDVIDANKSAILFYSILQQMMMMILWLMLVMMMMMTLTTATNVYTFCFLYVGTQVSAVKDVENNGRKCLIQKAPVLAKIFGTRVTDVLS